MFLRASGTWVTRGLEKVIFEILLDVYIIIAGNIKPCYIASKSDFLKFLILVGTMLLVLGSSVV